MHATYLRPLKLESRDQSHFRSVTVVANLTLALCLCLPGALGAQAGLEPLSFTVTNVLPFERPGEPLRCGLPLPRGFANRAAELTVIGPDDNPVPAQLLVTGTYADQTPRWVLVDFQPHLRASGGATYRLQKGSRAPIPQGLSYRLENGIATIETGAAQFQVNTRRFRLLDSAVVEGKELLDGKRDGGIRVREGEGAWRFCGSAITGAEFEDAGSLAVTLVVRGDLLRESGETFASFVCRLHFYAGKSEVRLFYTLRNPAAHHHPGNVWDLGSGGSLFLEDFSFCLPLAGEGWTSRIGSRVEDAAIPATRLYQDSSGGPNWKSANHIDKDYRVPTSFRGYRVSSTTEIVQEGLRADGWLQARGDRGGAAVAVREFWQNFPKTLEIASRSLRIGLWPREFGGAHEILGGEQKTHEMLLLFHAAGNADLEVERRMKAFHRPLYAMPDPDSIYATRAFWPTSQLDRNAHRMLEQTCDTLVHAAGSTPTTVMTQWETIDEFGWRHFGDTFADNERSPEQMAADFPEHHLGRQPISHFGNEYDVSYAVMLQGLRRSDPEWMWMADVLCRHYADICIYHSDREPAAAYAHAPFTHTTHDTAAFRSTHRIYPSEARQYKLQYGSGGPNAGHCYVASLAQHYYLTGDRVSREAFLEVADWTVHSPWFTEKMMGDTRGIGNFLMTHVYAYQLTKDRKFYDAAVQMLDIPRRPFEGLGATLFVKAAGRFLDMKAENDERDADSERALTAMLRFGDHYLAVSDNVPNESLEQTCFYAEILFTCYLHAPPEDPRRARYFARGKSLMDRAHDRWPGAYRPVKTLVMCFANTGAYFRALELKARESGDPEVP